MNDTYVNYEYSCYTFIYLHHGQYILVDARDIVQNTTFTYTDTYTHTNIHT